MCLLVWAHGVHPRYRLVLAANRDEFHGRPTRAASWWPERPALWAGRDLEAGGTWLGVNRAGRVAALTNVRDPHGQRAGAPSRGELVVQALEAPRPAAWLATLAPEAERYNPFNLVILERERAHYLGRDAAPRALPPGVWGMSNGPLHALWPKTERLRSLLAPLLRAEAVEPEALFRALHDTHLPLDRELPDTGVGLAWERVLAPIFVATPAYGTRCSTVVLIDQAGHVQVCERSYDAAGVTTGQVEVHFTSQPDPRLGPRATARSDR